MTPAVYAGCFIRPSIFRDITPASRISGRISKVQISFRLNAQKSLSPLIFSVIHGYTVRKPAWLCTAATVSASSTENTAHQTLAGIAVTESSMDKSLYFQRTCLMHGRYLFQGKLSGGTTPVAPFSSRNRIPSGPVTVICVLA